MNDNAKKNVGILVTGAALGAAAVILSDKRKREEVAAKMQEGMEKGKKAWHEGSKHLKGTAQDVQDAVEQGVAEAKKKVQTIQHQAQDMVDAVKEGAQRGKDAVRHEAEKVRAESVDTSRKLEKELAE